MSSPCKIFFSLSLSHSHSLSLSSALLLPVPRDSEKLFLFKDIVCVGYARYQEVVLL